MADLALGPDGDLDLSDDAAHIVDGDGAIVQKLGIRYKFFLGEWEFDRRVGIPYFERILLKNPNLTAIRSIYRQATVTCPGVSAIADFALTVDSILRKLSVKGTAQKDDGKLLNFNREFIIT